MKKLIATVLIVCYASVVYAGAEIFMAVHPAAGGGEFTSFTDNFTGSNGASLSSTHWNSSAAIIYNNKAYFTVSVGAPLTAQGKEDITLKTTHSFKVDIDNSYSAPQLLDTAYVSGIITVQDSASVGTTHNKVYAELRYDCTDGDGSFCYSSTMVAKLISTSSDGTPTTLWSGSCNSSETGVEIRFDNSLTNVRLYINGTAKGSGSSSITASLGSTVRVAMTETGNNVGAIEVLFDNMNVSVL